MEVLGSRRTVVEDGGIWVQKKHSCGGQVKEEFWFRRTFVVDVKIFIPEDGQL